jgi:hypothetical protein
MRHDDKVAYGITEKMMKVKVSVNKPIINMPIFDLVMFYINKTVEYTVRPHPCHQNMVF